jgi:raffinose/stachyose/melibiose transport system permease protein
LVEARDITAAATRRVCSLATAQGTVAVQVETVPLKTPGGQTGGPNLDLIVDATSQRILAVDPKGILRALPSPNHPSPDHPFGGLITGVQPLDDGRIVVCLGRSGFGVDYFLLGLNPLGARAGEWSLPTDFCTHLLAGNGRDIFYATKNARLTKVSRTGAKLWQAVLDQAPSALAVAPDGAVAAGDDLGFIALCSPAGQMRERFRGSDASISALLFLPGDMLLSADTAGTMRLFGPQGQLLKSLDLPTGAGRVRAIVRQGELIVAATDGSRMFQILGLATPSPLSLQAFRRLKFSVVGFLAASTVLLALASIGSLRASLRRQARQAWFARAAYLLVLPSFALLALFNYYPMLTALGYSFVKFSLTSAWEFVGLDNFRTMAGDPFLIRSVLNMLILLAAALVKMIALPLLAAELIFWLPRKDWQQFFRSAMVFPAVVPGVVMVLVWKMIYDPYSGLINVTLRSLGISAAPHAWLGDADLALWSVAFYNFPWINLLIFLIFLGGLLQIDRSIFEAVEMDGATMWQRFWHIDLPALRPKLNLAVTLIFIWSVQDFASVLILTGGGPGMATYVPALQMFQQITDGQNLGYTSAIGFALFLAVVVFTFISMKLNREHDPV